MKTITKFSALVMAVSLSACAGTIDKIENVCKTPDLRPLHNPVEQANYEPVSWPTPVEPAVYNKNPGSLWAAGARSFFKDQRATRVGDILTIVIEISDEADLTNKSTRSRNSSETLAAPKLFGLEKKALKVLPGDPDLDSLLSLNGDSTNEGDATIGRGEDIKLKIAAMITQVLPNGNLVVHGTQDVRVNFEVRQIGIEGVIRPQDISSENTVASEQIAEARISYGGQGTISDVQQPRYGTQIIDILSPF